MKYVDRLWQMVLIISTLAFSWLAMMVVHEAGHVIHLLGSGGSIEQVTLHPLKISHTLAGENPHPLVTVVGGPVWGILLPLVLWWLIHRFVPSRSYLAAFFAGFCLIANGAYLVGDAILQGGDGREFVLCGIPPWVLIAAGIPAFAAGLFVWNGLGARFGLGDSRGRVDWWDALGMAVMLVVVVVVELVFGG